MLLLNLSRLKGGKERIKT